MKASPSPLADLEAVLAEVPLFSGLNGEDLAALSSLAERQDLRSGARLYKEGDPSTHCYVVLRGRLRETSDGELLGYIGRLEPVGAIGIQMGEPRNSTIRAVISRSWPITCSRAPRPRTRQKRWRLQSPPLSGPCG